MPDSARDLELTSCDREPIHLLARVQPFGCLIAISADWLILHVSSNVADILGVPADDIIGTPFAALFTDSVAHTLRGRTQVLNASNQACRVFGADLFEDGRLFDISIHPTNRGFIYEFEEKADLAPRNDMELVQTLLATVRLQDHPDDLLRAAASAMRGLCGFDRVMVYRFGPDGSGHVIAEAAAPGVESFLGLRYPASDIPKQARALYRKNHLRLIADVDAEVLDIVPARCPNGDTIDLSGAVTRAVSPVHLQYLRNMGVRASMSSSIIQNGALWGLFACHHDTPRYVDYERRTAIELFTQLVAYELADRLNAELREEVSDTKALHDRIMLRVSNGLGLFDGFADLADEIHELIEFDGIAIFSDDRYISLGAAPSEDEFMRLVRFLNTTTMGNVFATDHLAERYAGAAALSDRVAGVLVLPISRSPRDYIVLFRAEVRRSVTWAGRPEKAVTHIDGQPCLSPRTSFAAWQEDIRGRCAPWTDRHLSIADTLRHSLLEVVLKVTDEAGRTARHLRQKQELLIAELNHRVRNILSLISGIVSQANRADPSLETYVANLESRIQALARAHDQLTQQDWAAASFFQLVKAEIAAYTQNDGDAVLLDGTDVRLEPQAFTTLALVVHELVTNAMKYGALSSRNGRIHLSCRIDRTGAYVIHWVEQGGPAVQAPTREGFGSTILNHSIPFDLQGLSDVRFNVSGLVAEFAVPASHFETVAPHAECREAAPSPGRAQPQPPAPAPEAPPSAPAPLDGLELLLVEDNIVIAMDTKAKLTKLGARCVQIASSVRVALKVMDEASIQCAVLDVNLGDEVSIGVAQRLHAAGIPFILATGYGTDQSALDGYPDVTIMVKPYSLDDLGAALATELARHDASIATPDASHAAQ
ncbi:HWE histidine kinase domain-containing protein [uncultured Jannaschia sp.]|uniref:HWE histidine kinase domain-containing protein n=1 Tax=uncultured Jannaschia sp. TaxID=293347 RepID=UPI00260DA758|nr:HWE histidine kinase domain-containing protein [uncultured Jannaschia sp.]